MQLLPLFRTALAMAAFSIPLQAQEEAPLAAEIVQTLEPLGNVKTADFVPPGLLEGPLHRVGTLAYNDGFRNTYFLVTGTAEIEVTGTPELMQRIQELYAIEKLRATSRTEEFGKAIAAAGKEKLQSVEKVVRDPIGTIKRVPKGASRFFGRIGEGMREGKQEGDDSALQKMAGVSKAKAKLAAQLNVSPYTTNEALQHELTAVARAMAGGGLIVTAASSAVGGGAGTALSVIGVNQTLQETLVNSTPEDLRMRNRKKLLALGGSKQAVEEFLQHPWYSPWHETIITEALAGIGVSPNDFLAHANDALTAEDAFYFQRLAQLLAAAHAATPLKAVRSEAGIVGALTRDGLLVVPISLDYARWTERVARRAEEFLALDAARQDVNGLALWTDGRVSERLAAELKKRGIGIQTEVFGKFAQ